MKKGSKIALAVVGTLIVIGGISSIATEDDESVTTAGDTPTSPSSAAEVPPAEELDPSPEEALDEAETLAWMETDNYQEFCTGEPDIDPELQQAVDAVDIPEQGHVQFTNIGTDRDNEEMVTVFFAVCSPAEGDDLRAIAEDLAVEVQSSPIGTTVSEMGVNASSANPDGVENILRDSNFQMHLHDNGPARENGAYRAAWEAQN
ncbi:hypothetical protein HMPREF0290_0905 [Corynebacterium efficiens YS-314]|uniref:Uncharacterized protein n=1 Tax=Corynebacterium efficiens (strain DSM 44549 / YS-314 / AJ 12310 / JCM 11189 / NBRC 100395) TaxID=196164 RepID=Q8FRE0_COREF|nr:hypothetical protein [Corynebacterium efficiens]EEW50457.1 hypothetical protein HMPREF0290_0905 [Corynebacterium efficiens YS-314]BAC17631.1 hypothetical protein [Corynebacterium efficiens YS-314]